MVSSENNQLANLGLRDLKGLGLPNPELKVCSDAELGLSPPSRAEE